MSIKEQIFSSAQAAVTEAVATPEWSIVNGSVYVKSLTAKQRDAWEADIVGDTDSKRRNLHNLRSKFVVLCACEQDGSLMFDAKDANRLGDEPSAVVDRLWEAGRKLSGISDDDNEEMVKNSSETTDDASPTS